jgi:MoaA/NifB/PqqE/SkfB family radical SAM enzyme
MVSHEIDQGRQPSYNDLMKLLSDLPEGEWVDFFGGEPTLYSGFWELLEYSAARGHRISLATNGRFFRQRKEAERIARFPVAIRSSLYGDDAELHDYLTRMPGSFEETRAGLKNLVDCDCRVMVNVVMLQENMKRLGAITRLLATWGVKRVKYSMLIDGSKHRSSIAPVDGLRSALWEAIDDALENGIYFVLEKSPYCLQPLFLTQCHPESDPLMINASSELYAKPEICSDCVAIDYCPGVEKSYLAKFGSRGLEPIKVWPEHLIHTMEPEEIDAYRPRYPTNLIRLEKSADPDDSSRWNLGRKWQKLRMKYREHRLIRIF